MTDFLSASEHQAIPRGLSVMGVGAAAQALLLAVLVVVWPQSSGSAPDIPATGEPLASAAPASSSTAATGPGRLGTTSNTDLPPNVQTANANPSSSNFATRAYVTTAVQAVRMSKPRATLTGTRISLIPAAVETTRRSIEDDIFNHVWQSTLFAALIGLLAIVLRRSEARVRYWLWFAASVKFLIPIAALRSVGAMFPLASAPAVLSASAPAASALTHLAQPFTRATVTGGGTSRPGSALDWLPALLWLIWLFGAEFVVLRRVRAWRRVRTAAAESRPAAFREITVPAGIPIRVSDTLFEPGTIGLWTPMLLVPAGIDAHLSPAELQAVIDHEACHIRSRDNLTACLQMLAEAMFWFHPLVWWIGARMINERERACDEYVLATIENPRTYADAIVHICQSYVEAGLASVAGVGGGDLRRRIERIMRHEVGQPVGPATRAWLAAGAAFLILAPVGIGAITTARPPRPQAIARQAFEIVSVKPVEPTARSGWRNAPGRITGTFTAKTLISLAFSSAPEGPFEAPAPFPPARIVGGPDWIESGRFTIAAEAPHDGLTNTANPVAFGRPLAPFVKSLLEDRFKLAAHVETREFPVYALVLARSDGRLGPNLHRSQLTEADCEARREHPSRELKACGAFTVPGDPVVGVPVSRAIGFLGPVDRIVVDRTGLRGLFDIAF